MIHVQSHDGPVMKLYLWDQAATDVCKKFNSCENTPTVLLVTTVNTKRLGGTLALSSMSSTRVFMDYDAVEILQMRRASGRVAVLIQGQLNAQGANKSEGADHEVPVPEALISTIGQTHKFCVKVTDHNFSGNTRAITVTKILPLDTPPPTEASVGNAIGATSEEAKESGNDVCEPPTGRGDPADEETKRTCSSADPGTAKRPRCEN
ncbi:hypothetical protein F2Q68_00009009 [Brassica cretica]|uniref:Replication factor A C-terminal domain-containing protein n=1 Tax=Brassica cretica TaxID=69181 RepID=A0A8S9KYF0_BRACR|nr:hypothetical protein F2Q68_00009009 [Brassica cretica]